MRSSPWKCSDSPIPPIVAGSRQSPREASDHDTAQSNFADAMHAALVRRADALDGSLVESEEEELRAIADTIEAIASTSGLASAK